jgi:hypothetical protein
LPTNSRVSLETEDLELEEVEFTLNEVYFSLSASNELLANTVAVFMVTVVFDSGVINQEAFITVSFFEGTN